MRFVGKKEKNREERLSGSVVNRVGGLTPSLNPPLPGSVVHWASGSTGGRDRSVLLAASRVPGPSVPM